MNVPSGVTQLAATFHAPAAAIDNLMDGLWGSTRSWA
jgi:hypothetical protein